MGDTEAKLILIILHFFWWCIHSEITRGTWPEQWETIGPNLLRVYRFIYAPVGSSSNVLAVLACLVCSEICCHNNHDGNIDNKLHISNNFGHRKANWGAFQRELSIWRSPKNIWKVEGSPKSVADPGFPRREGQPEGDANDLFDNVHAENCMKMKEFGPGCIPRAMPLDPPLKMPQGFKCHTLFPVPFLTYELVLMLIVLLSIFFCSCFNILSIYLRIYSTNI